MLRRLLTMTIALSAVASCSPARPPPTPLPASSPEPVAASAAAPLPVAVPLGPASAPLLPLAQGVVAGDEILDFGLPRLDLASGELGELVWLSDMVGGTASAPKRVVLLNFFATWCEPCFTEMQLLNEWQERYGARGLQILGVNYRAPVQDIAEALAGTRAKVPADLRFPLLFERHTRRNQSAYLGDGDIVFPANVVIDAHGRVLARLHGGGEEVLDQLRRIIESHVKGE